MSVNDILNDKDLVPALLIGLSIAIIFLFITIPMGISKAKKTTASIYGDDEFGAIQEEKNAKIIAKRPTPHPLPFNQAIMVNMVVFELANGSRIELAIKAPNTYGIMVEGDCGSLKYQGKKFISFERGSDSEA